MIKMNLFIKRRADLTFEQFAAYWKDTHWPIVHGVPEVQKYTRRYVQQHNTNQVPEGLPAADFDGIAEAWFDDMDAVAAVVTSKNWAAVVQKDDLNFLDPSKTKIMFTEERIDFRP